MFKRSKNKPDIANLKINDTEEKQLVLTEVSTEEKDRKKHTQIIYVWNSNDLL